MPIVTSQDSTATSEKPIRTMEDFAAFVGLSRPTVSKYFNDPHSVRPRTREVIEAAIRVSGFQPNLFAVNLNRRRTNILGLVMPHIDPFYAELRRRIESIAEQSGYLCFSLSSDGNPELEQRAIETFKSLNVAGAIIAPVGIRSHHAALESLGRSIPLVYVDSPLDESSSFVGTNNRQSFELIVDYLIRSGEPPCYLPMPSVNNNAIARQAAYVAAMERVGLEPRVLPVTPVETWDFERFAFEESVRIVRDGGFPTATVLCACDRLAFGVLAACFQAGLRIGHGLDIRVAGHDDQPLSRYTCPPLTTVAQNTGEIGRLAIDLLFQKMGDDVPAPPAADGSERILLNAELMLRSSA